MKDSIVLGGGCFWCLDALFQRVRGVQSVTCGYAGGDQVNPHYDDLHKAGNTHAEVVKIVFDSSQIELMTLLEIFWAMHDPTTPNQQGADIGVQYRSIILYASDQQLDIVEQSVRKTAVKLWSSHITTEIKLLDIFYPAESEHQDYFNNHPEQAYCQLIINPKLTKFKHKFADLIDD